jgi:hypothetical protein
MSLARRVVTLDPWVKKTLMCKASFMSVAGWVSSSSNAISAFERTDKENCGFVR